MTKSRFCFGWLRLLCLHGCGIEVREMKQQRTNQWRWQWHCTVFKNRERFLHYATIFRIVGNRHRQAIYWSCRYTRRKPTNIKATHYIEYAIASWARGKKPSSSWTRPPGSPRRTWLNLVQEDANAIPLSSLWRTEIFRGMGRRNGPSGLRDDDDDDDIASCGLLSVLWLVNASMVYASGRCVT